MRCRNPANCREKATRWKETKEKYMAIAEAEFEMLQEQLATGKARLIVSKHTEERQYHRAFSLASIHEAIRNGWPIHRRVEDGIPVILLMAYIKTGKNAYRPVHIPIMKKNGQWVAKTVYDPSTRPWQWENNYQDRVCFCKHKHD